MTPGQPQSTTSQSKLSKGLLAYTVIAINTLFWFTLILSLGLLRLILPINPIKKILNQWLDNMLEGWVWVCKQMLHTLKICRIDLNIEAGLILNRSDWYIVICNHQSWADILILQSIFSRRIPPLKFFTKKQLIWIPMLGLAMWILGFPYVNRRTSKEITAHPELADQDRDNTRKSCQQFASKPSTVLNFLEGTRFSKLKREKSGAQYKHLLNPKIGGFGIVSEHLGDKINKIIDVTIIYPAGAPGFFSFLCGTCQTIKVDITGHKLPEQFCGQAINEDEQRRSDLKQWLSRLWETKDALLSEHYNTSPATSEQDQVHTGLKN